MNPQQKFKVLHELEKVFGFKIPKDGLMMAASKTVVIDVFEFDRQCSYHDSEYDAEKCTYKGEECSLQGYILKKFGEDVANKLKLVL